MKILRAKTVYADMLMQQDAFNKGLIKKVNFQGSSSERTEALTAAPSLFTPLELNKVLLANGVVLPELAAYTENVTTPPGIPIASGVAGNASVELSWDVPSNGGLAITGYSVSSTDETVPITSTLDTNVTITGLTNGTTYTFNIIAINPIGVSLPSIVTLTPVTVPGNPTISGVRGNASVVLSWNVPSNGGSAITGYTIASGAEVITTTSTTTTITGLQNGAPYTFNVVAINAIGASDPIAVESSITLRPATIPESPIITQGDAVDSSVYLQWTPQGTGGSDIIDYILSTTNGITTTTTTAISTGANIEGLTNGTSYTFTVIARNAVGNSLASDSISRTPVTVPGNPTISGVRGNASVVLSWNVPSNGGSAITEYIVQRNGGSTTTTSTTATITGLTNGTSYTFNVIAKNAIGYSDTVAVESRITLTPATVPTAPTLSGVSASSSAILSWNIPSNGGSAITGYRVTSINGNVSTTSTTTTITGLTNGIPYTFSIIAINAVGNSLSSASISVTPALIWTAAMSAGSRQWRGIASSDDGTRVVAVAYDGNIWVSADSGATWTARGPSLAWTCVTSSFDGKNLAAGVSGGYIHTSTDYGASWTPQTNIPAQFVWVDLVSSSDGNILMGCTGQDNNIPDSGYIYKSSNGGASWTKQETAGRKSNWTVLASSRDGNILYAATQLIYRSTNSGDWVSTSNRFANWAVLIALSTGTTLISSAYFTGISYNSGTSWTEMNHPKLNTPLNSMVASSDGTKLVAATNEQSLYTSTDSGVTWTKQTKFNTNGTISAGLFPWNKVASSSNGQKLFAATTNSYIYIT